MIDTLPYLLYQYDLPLEDGVARVCVCVNLIDARAIGVASTKAAAIRHMEHTWEELNGSPKVDAYQCEDRPNPACDDSDEDLEDGCAL